MKIVTLLTLLLLTACGGGRDEDDSPIPTNPCSVEYIDRFGFDENWEKNCRIPRVT